MSDPEQLPTAQTRTIANKFNPNEFRQELLQAQADQFDVVREETRELRGKVDRLTTLIEILQRKETERSEADSFMMQQLHDAHQALDSLIHTFDTPSQMEKRAILENAIRAVNAINVRFGKPFREIPLS